MRPLAVPYAQPRGPENDETRTCVERRRRERPARLGRLYLPPNGSAHFRSHPVDARRVGR